MSVISPIRTEYGTPRKLWTLLNMSAWGSLGRHERANGLQLQQHDIIPNALHTFVHDKAKRQFHGSAVHYFNDLDHSLIMSV